MKFRDVSVCVCHTFSVYLIWRTLYDGTVDRRTLQDETMKDGRRSFFSWTIYSISSCSAYGGGGLLEIIACSIFLVVRWQHHDVIPSLLSQPTHKCIVEWHPHHWPIKSTNYATIDYTLWNGVQILMTYTVPLCKYPKFTRMPNVCYTCLLIKETKKFTVLRKIFLPEYENEMIIHSIRL